MKTSNKSNITTGVVLLLIAAIFSISLILQALDFGSMGAGSSNPLFILGNVIFTVYGFSSTLIPLFLFIAGLSCFATKWSARKTMRLLTAIVPFFTAVITENICRSILALEHSGFPGVKVFVAVVTGLMLIIIEFLGAGIIADKINPILFGPKSKRASSAQPRREYEESQTAENEGDEISEEKVNPAESFDSIGKLNTEGLIFGKGNEAPAETKVEVKSKEEPAPQVATLSCSDNFDSIKSDEIEELDPNEVVEDDEDLEGISAVNAVDTDEVNGSDLQAVNQEIKNEVSNVFDAALSEIKPHAEPSIDVEEEDEAATPGASIITEEEYAALTDFSDELEDESEEEEAPAEELKWDNLPPEQETLPPEYDEDYAEEDAGADSVEEEIDENDPALEFPPKEEEGAANSEDDPFSAFDVDDEKVSNAKKNSNAENPYSAAKYIDSVVENPNFGHGITLRDGTEPEESEEEKKTPEQPKSKFPSRINLSDSENEDGYVEDETLPFPDIPDEEPELEKEEEPRNHAVGLSSFVPATFDDDAISRAAANSSALYAASHEKPAETFGSGNVFDEMEEEIRRESLKKLSEETEKAYQKGELEEPELEQIDAEIIDNEDVADIKDTDEEPLPTVNDLTATNEEEIQAEIDDSEHDDVFEDESVAFNDEVNSYTPNDAFAHEDEPKSQEIMANPPKIGNRAVKKGPYVIPSNLLTAYKDDQYWIIDDATKESAMNLTQTLAEFNIEAQVIGIKKGPVVTMFEILPAPGVRLQKIVALQDNIALSLAAQSVRIVAPIPGKQAVGIEVPNRHRSIVGFRELIEMKLDEWDKMAVPVVLGKDILGKAQLIDLVKTPHMLIAGATGSGKSVCVNSLILSILYKRSFRDVKLILVDPKVVELKLYNNIPHLLVPVITEPKKALQALQWCLCEMERRYALLDSMGVRDISTYNQRIKERDIATEKLPYIVVIIDEFADLMATSGRELESTVARLTAMSRAVGIHLVLATQRPSVNVITGLIKANIPSRIAFMVSSRTDSNIIIDSVGAEKLLGRGDMLYASAVDPAPVRIQGTFISDQEVEDVVNAVKEYGEPDYIDDQVFYEEEEDGDDFELNGNYEGDPLYDQALEIVIQSGKASASYLQRRLSIGYNRAARLVEEMEERGIVGPANGSKPREIIHVPG
ncbi:DNA translocase FtsK [Treponema sp. C6A8]|uniref:DNA translocase FtsK n=1 Tax=Treponema sp. C6A8 TaxID=1410609 RepID=UPI0006882A38